MSTLQSSKGIKETDVEIGKSRLSKIGFYVVLILFALFFLLPLIWMVVTSLKPFEEWLNPNWIPVNPTLENFNSIFNDKTLPVVNWFFNSLLIAGLFTAFIFSHRLPGRLRLCAHEISVARTCSLGCCWRRCSCPASCS